MNHPTPKQKVVLDFIASFCSKHGFSPSRREIASGLGLSSVATVQQHIDALERKGFLAKVSQERRGVELLQSPVEGKAHLLPLLGQVAAGYPIEAIESMECIEVPSFMLKQKGDYFVLRVSGNSMRDDGIFDRDYVIIRKQSVARNGETVVALVENEATIKRFYKRAHCIELHPANPEFHPIIVTSDQKFQIKGILAGVIRSF
jgi:repressor LexA